MPDKSSYLRHLPPVLWEKEPPPPEFSLGAMLRIFEKILTGIDDTEVILHGDHEHESVKAVIDRIHRLFHPWTTPPEFMDWLASWVSLKLSPIWDEYESRKIISQIVQVYRRRGLKEGLDRYLDLYAVTSKRPRIAIDDCSRVLITRPAVDSIAPIHTLISQGPIVAPLCIAVGPDKSLFVADAGTPLIWPHTVPPALWRLPPPGRYPFDGVPPEPVKLPSPVPTLTRPVALVTDQVIPWNLYALDRVGPPGTPALHVLPSPNFGTVTTVATKTQLGTVWPMAMALDKNGHLLILDRGAPPAMVSVPKIIDVQPAPLLVSSRNLNEVVEPLSLMVQPGGDLIIGDGREQTTTDPADLVRVDRSIPAVWTESRLLVGASENPLAAPTAVVRWHDGTLYVLDVGLKPFRPSSGFPYIRELAEPATIYRVDIGVAPPDVRRAAEVDQLVFPTGMVADEGTLYVCDRGEHSQPGSAGKLLQVWRDAAHQFGVVAHFTGPPPTTPQEKRERRRFVHSVYEVLETEAPAHTRWTVVYSV